MEQLLSAREAARRLGMSVATIKRLIHSGELPAVRTTDTCSGHWRIRESTIERWVDRRMGKTG